MAQIELLEHDVKRLGDMNDVLLNQIASLDLRQNGQEVRVAVIEEPTVATSAVFPRLSYVVLLTCPAAVLARPWRWSRCWTPWTTASARSTRCRAGWAYRCWR